MVWNGNSAHLYIVISVGEISIRNLLKHADGHDLSHHIEWALLQYHFSIQLKIKFVLWFPFPKRA